MSFTLQCARRWFDEGKTSHLVNLGKYVSAMLAAGAKVAYEKEQTVGWLCLLVIVSTCATVYQLYWDFVKDWGFFQTNSKNPWLRDELILRHKFIYYVSMVQYRLLNEYILRDFSGQYDAYLALMIGNRIWNIEYDVPRTKAGRSIIQFTVSCRG